MSAAGFLSPRRAAHLFAVANIAFLGLDVLIAHSVNDFARRAEWVPIFFSGIATPLLLPGAFGSRRPAFALVDRAIGWLSIVVGTAGMVFHLESSFFERHTLHSLVYSAPFVAPLAYVGVGLLLLLVRSKEAETPAFGPWVVLLALGGFIGNFALSALDHAQNGFFDPSEWIAVAAAAFGVTFLAMMLTAPSRLLLVACSWLMALEVLVGVVGFKMHVTADYARQSAPLIDRFVFGAPPFAPLLFADIAVLAGIGLWAWAPHLRAEPGAEAA